MTNLLHSKLASTLFSTSCLVAFAMLVSPVIRTGTSYSGGLQIREAMRPPARTDVRVAAGKSVIVDSPAQIVRASVSKPELAAAVTIDDHQILVHAKYPGDTKVTLWEAGGGRKELVVRVEKAPDTSVTAGNHRPTDAGARGVVASYEDAMDRVQAAISGAAR